MDKYILTEEFLTELRSNMYPRGSGPLSVMAVCVKLIDAIAEEKNWNVGQIDNPYPPKQGKRK